MRAKDSKKEVGSSVLGLKYEPLFSFFLFFLFTPPSTNGSGEGMKFL